MALHPHRPYRLEACVVSFAQALEAEEHGADRVEICTRLETEGMTPAFEEVRSLCNRLKIPVRVMIRATEAGFEVDEKALDQMIQDIHDIKILPIEGFVMGVMENGKVARESMERLIQSANPLPITFHKAIDQSLDIFSDIEWLNQFPQIDTILTSGGSTRAVDGIAQILKMKTIFHGEIMAAGKITPDQLPILHKELDLTWYHGRAIL